MHLHQIFAVIPLLWATAVSALDIPSNLQSLYRSLTNNGGCSEPLGSGFYTTNPHKNTYSYCGDYIDNKVVYIQGLKRNLANMDIDCNGVQGRGEDDRCSESKDTPGPTSFQSTVHGYHQGISDLNPTIHSYIVFGNDGEGRHVNTFDPKKYGIQPLSVVAVICDGQLYYGVLGDQDGENKVGQASLALATACFGDDMDGDNGHEKNDVLYLAFPGRDAVPGAGGATWNARDFDGFHDSIIDLGNELIQRIPQPSGNWSLAAGGSPKWRMG